MTDDVMSQADADIDYLYAKAAQVRIPVSEEDEDIFIELVGKQYSDGKRNLEARVLAFANWSATKGRT